MKLHKKYYWKISNILEYLYRHFLKRGTGVFKHREDSRDEVADLGFFKDKPTFEPISHFNGEILNQIPHLYQQYPQQLFL